MGHVCSIPRVYSSGYIPDHLVCGGHGDSYRRGSCHIVWKFVKEGYESTLEREAKLLSYLSDVKGVKCILEYGL